MGQNTFTGANLVFKNKAIHALLAEIIKFRKQLTVRSEFKQQSGWDNALNNYMVRELDKLHDTVENITYNPDSQSLDTLKRQVVDVTRGVVDDYNTRALASDNLVMPVGLDIGVVWDLTGADVDVPQISTADFPNDAARMFIKQLDTLFVEATRLDSRFQSDYITKYEGLILTNYLNVLYAITQRKGSEANRSDIPQGTLPSQEGSTFNPDAAKAVSNK